MITGCTPELSVVDVNKTVDWYEKFLGFKLVMSVPDSGEFDWALVKHNSVSLMFQTKKSLEEELPSLKKLKIESSMILYFDVSNVKELYELFKGKTEIAKELHQTFYGSTEFAIKDCNGYILMFSQK